MRALRWTLALVAVVLSGLLGHHLGVQRERKTVANELAEKEFSVAAIAQQYEQQYEQQYQAQIAQLRTQRDVADASNRSLQQTLQQLQAETLERESALRLYNSIEGKDSSAGLGVDTITRVNGQNGKPKELHVTVVQARGRNRVKGQIGLALVGEKTGTPFREVIADTDSASALDFDMRFFQTVVVPLPKQENHIDIVEIDIKPDGKRHKSVTFSMDWSSILEE